MSTGPFYPGGTITKDPDADLPYDFDWSEWLGEDATIASAEVDVPDGLTLEDDDIIDGTTVRARITGGTANQVYAVRCRVTTNETPPRIDDRTINLRIRER